MRHWLIKSEPDVFSIDDLARVGREPWSGVRNYQARNYMWKDMKPGDLALFYHSNAKPPGIAGIAKVVGSPYPDPTQFDKASDYYDPKATPENPRWWLTDFEFVRADTLTGNDAPNTLSEGFGDDTLYTRWLLLLEQKGRHPKRFAEFWQ